MKVTAWIVMPAYAFEGIVADGEPFTVYFSEDEADTVVDNHTTRDDAGDWFDKVEIEADTSFFAAAALKEVFPKP